MCVGLTLKEIKVITIQPQKNSENELSDDDLKLSNEVFYANLTEQIMETEGRLDTQG
jgi:hypothetical protein